jgi:putative molybdopterin biosynthesis protein
MVNRYLALTSLEHALSILTTSFQVPEGRETIPITQAVGRVVAVPVYAQYSVPEANISAMDGIAVRSSDTIGASEQAPVTLEHFARVNTGNIVPQGFDAVIMIEDTWQTGGKIQIQKSIAPNQHVRPVGEDIKENQLVLPSGHLLRPFDIGALATYGVTHVEVKSIEIGIIPTGSELVPLGVRPAPGQVVESNTIMAQVFLGAMGAHCTRYPIIRDDPDLIAEMLTTAVRDNDLILISAGSSAGTRDFTAGVISSLGELLFHGVAIRPGKPVLLGKIGKKPVLGLPGYPLAAQTILREFAAPLLETWGFAQAQRYTLRAKLSQAINSDLGFDDFVPVYAGRVGQTCWCVPHMKGAGVQMATVRANGYTHIPAPLEGYESESEVDIILTTDPNRIDRTLIVSGSLDPSLEDLANFVHNKGLFIHATEFGNIGAMLAIQKNACHAAPMNLPAFSLLPDCRFLMQHMPKGGLVLIHIATIETGIASRVELDPEDFVNVRWINTRKDSAYRMLFDAMLSSRRIDPASVHGYNHEVNGPDAVATAIRNKIADAGMCNAGITAAAGLHFIPTGLQRYGLAIRPEMLGDSKICSLIAAIRSPEYRSLLSEYSGYDLSETGAAHQYFEDHTIREITKDTLQAFSV